MTKNPVFHARTKHIEVHQHYIREQVQKKEIELIYCSTEDQAADIFTKPLNKDKFVKFQDKLGVTKINIKGGY